MTNKIEITRALYTVYDLLAGETVGPIFPSPTDHTAMRDFATVCADPQTTIGKNPADYQLICVGYIRGMVIEPDTDVILTGSQWLATQEKGTTRAARPVADFDSPGNGPG